MSMYEESGLGRPPRVSTSTWPVSFRIDYLAKLYLRAMAKNLGKTQTEVLEGLIFAAHRKEIYNQPILEPESNKGVYIKRERRKIIIEIHVPDSGIS